MTIKITLSLAPSADGVQITSPTVFKLPTRIARLKHGEHRATDYHKFFWGELRWKNSELEHGLNSLAEAAADTKTLKLYCDCGDLDTCHGNTIREYLIWVLNKKGFEVKAN